MTAAAEPLRVTVVSEADRADWRRWAQARAQEAFLQGRLAGERGDNAASRRWLERARRISLGATHVDVALAFARIGAGDANGAIMLLRDLLRRFDFREGWVALAAAHHALRQPDEAAQALQRALSHHAPDPAMTAMMGHVTHAAMWPGWCGLSGSGRLLVDGADAFARIGAYDMRLDGERLRDRLPARWRQGHRIEVRRGSAPLLGSPLDVRSILRTEGFVEWSGEGLRGWLWHPGEPERAPRLSIVGADGSRRRLRLDAFAEQIDSETPLARPRRLLVPAAGLPQGALRLLDEDDRALTGSPIDPGPLRRMTAPRRGPRPIPAGYLGRDPSSRPPNPDFDVVIPVYRHLRRTLECIDGVRESIPPGTRIVVVEDASPEPALCAALDGLAATGAIVLIRHAGNRGFPCSANAGIAACAGRDVVLLNSDTLVAGRWTAALREAAYGAPDIGTATPFSNDASILSYPDIRAANPVPDRAATARLMALATAANKGGAVDIPTGNGFCWYLRRDCLDQAGPLREDLFAQGYGEENEFCLRARHLGWRHVGATGAYVGHVGGVSFGAAREALMRRNLDILNRLHPGYDALIQAHVEADPLAPARRRIDRRRFIADRKPSPRAVLLVSHDEAGGVERVVRARAVSLAAEGVRPIVLRPQGRACLVDVPAEDARDAGTRQFPNLRYVLPREMDRLVALLSGEGLLHAEWHHLLGHHPQVRTLCERLAIPYDVYIHDYAWFCARIALVGPAARYCGEPDVAGCEACIAVQGSSLSEAIRPAALRLRSSAELAGARAVVAPSDDAARRIARHFPGIRPRVSAWEDDAPGLTLAQFADPAPLPASLLAATPRRARVCVIGGIGVEKGYDILLACLRDSARRDLALDFVVVGHTPDDDALFEAGVLDVTGPYREEEAVGLVRSQRCDLALLPSVCPETWCFTLGIAWHAGLAVAAFDIGAQAERIRRTGRGAVLPLGLPVGILNDTLQHLCGANRLPDAGFRQAAKLSGDATPLRMVP